MTEAQAAAEWQGFVHGEGTGWKGQGRARARLLARLVGRRASRPSRRPASRPVVEDEPTLFEIWVCADGYWADHTKNLCPGELTPRYARARAACSAVYDDAVDFCRPGREPRRARPPRPRGHRASAGYPGQPSHPICHGIGARAHEPPYAHQAGGGEIARGDGAGDRAGHLLARAAAAAPRGQLPDHRGRRREALALPGRLRRLTDRLDLIWTGPLNDAAPDRRAGRPLRHDPARRRADRRRRPRPGAEARDRAGARRARHRADRGRLPARLAGRLATRSS